MRLCVGAALLALMGVLTACEKNPEGVKAAPSSVLSSAAEGHGATSPSASGGTVSAPPVLARVDQARLRVTHGALAAGREGAIGVRDPEVRAVAPWTRAEAAELDFTYLGPSDKTAPLASGEVRRQIGLKLRAADGCNLIYVMWRIEPKEELVVSVKENAGQRTHAECGARGYRNVKSEATVLVPKLTVGSAHSLAAQMDGEMLTVKIDGALAWRGSLGASVARLSGPVGFRTDNATFDLSFLAAPGSDGSDSILEDE
jgi:hypothetical protein